jgi:Flp pilus assembly protein TadG
VNTHSGRLAKPAIRNPRRGAALIEAALVLPVFLLILLCGVDFSRMFYTAVAVAGAANAGARYAVSNGPQSSADTAAIENAARAGARSPGITATATRHCECADNGSVNCSSSCARGEKPRTYVEVSARTIIYPLTRHLFWPAEVPVIAKAIIRAE